VPAADSLAVLDAIAPEQVPAAILRLTARLVATPHEEPADRTLTPQEAAALLRTSTRFVWRNARALGATRLSARKIVLSERKVRRWLEARR
jgi:hypothetical protein